MFAIAIDGPSGAGKSTLAKSLAKELGFLYVDTGALYRTIGLYMSRQGVDLSDSQAVIAALPGVELSLAYQEGSQHVFLNGQDVSSDIRQPSVAMAASMVSAIPAVRAFLLETQRGMARVNNVIMDGRDIGTVILPDAQVKIFLVSNPETRAKRRCLELQEKGVNSCFEEVLAGMAERDRKDATRATAPAVAAPDAVLLDNSGLDLPGTVAAALEIIRPHLGR